jgi:DNA helicase-2/ATP-dependent DNA helicase PcrA
MKHIALLYRTNALSRIYEESFIKARIPHTLIGGSSFYERSDIKPVIEYLELVEQTAEERTPNSSDIPRRTTQALALLGVKKRSTARFRKIVEYHLHNKQVLTPAHVIGDIVHATRIKGDNVDELLYLARGYTNITLSEFLSEIRLMQELDIADWGKDTVKLMTAHSAKGLEFPVVFIVDLIEDIFPLTKKMASKEEIEEERRLCYVAITRAKKKLYLLYPKRRYGRYQQPSRFLVDMFTTA